MKKKRLVILILQIVIIAIAAFMFMTISRNTVKPTEVYVYERDIVSVDEPLTESDVRLTSIPKAATSEDFATSLDEIVGMYVDGKSKAGQFVYKTDLITLEEVDPFEQMDLTRYRKISMPISFVEGFSGNIMRGDRVDLVYTGEGETKETEDQDSEPFKYSKVFLQDVLVYSVNTEEGFKFKDYSDKTMDNLNDEEITQASEMTIITLAVTLEQAEEINTRMSGGKVSFLGRFTDSKSYNTLGFVLGDYQKIHSGKGSAETGNMLIEEDSFDLVD